VAVSVTIDSASTAGPISVRYTGSVSGSGNGASWANLETLDLELTGSLNINSEYGALLLFMAWWKARSADLSNTAIAVGKTLIVDLSNNNPIRVQ